MSDYIYPECPDCGTKAPSGDGVGLYEMPEFEWACPGCGRIHEGEFLFLASKVKWHSSRDPSTTENLAGRVKGVLGL